VPCRLAISRYLWLTPLRNNTARPVRQGARLRARYSRQVLNPSQACRHREHVGDFHGELPPAAKDSPDYSLGILGAKWREVFSGRQQTTRDRGSAQARVRASRLISIRVELESSTYQGSGAFLARVFLGKKGENWLSNGNRKLRNDWKPAARGACLELLCIALHSIERLSGHTCGE